MSAPTDNALDNSVERSFMGGIGDVFGVATLRDSGLFFRQFLSLPRELRDNIYEAKFSDCLTNITLRRGPEKGKKEKFPALLPHFCYINRQVFNESVPILLRNRNITVTYVWDLESLINVLSWSSEVDPYRAITSLTLETLTLWNIDKIIARDRRPDDPNLCGNNLVQRCSALKSLTLELSSYEMVIRTTKPGAPPKFTDVQRRTWDGFRAYFGTAIFESARLRSLVLRCDSPYYAWMVVIGCKTVEEYYSSFLAWVREEMIERKTRAELRIEHVDKHYRRLCVGFDERGE
ncbi:hypothetical protein P154DRAFT_523640 [Amniculicola lignicola CBS 123094]|uniref:Uncharacterized protein n=1 Tax=Amniculicola lignicola CBS 123094 TaxID=1392246 RepID=A0A6A5WAU9_9PLEO|nr:hypothetical protein P154DRAFT_523640 [Amniculicola lignicola CBS 123094]